MTDSTESTVQFGDLPPAGRQHTDWVAVASQLRARPNSWACVATYKSPGGSASRATQIRAGLVSSMPGGQFEATARGKDVWARFVGERS